MFLHRSDFLIVTATHTPRGVVVNEYFEDLVVGYYKASTFLAYLLLRKDICFEGIPDSYIHDLLMEYRRGNIAREGVILLLQDYNGGG